MLCLPPTVSLQGARCARLCAGGDQGQRLGQVLAGTEGAAADGLDPAGAAAGAVAMTGCYRKEAISGRGEGCSAQDVAAAGAVTPAVCQMRQQQLR